MRRTPLTRRAPLRAKASKAAHERPPAPAMDLDAARSALARHRASRDWTAQYEHRPVPPLAKPAPKPDGSFPPVVRQTIIDRDQMRCQKCGRPTDSGSWPGYSLQHRIARQSGGTSDPLIGRAPNGLLLCGSATTGCHGEVEGDTDGTAERNGWAVASWADPTSVPVLTYRGWRLLGDNGTSWPTNPPPGDDAHAVAQRRHHHNEGAQQ